MMIEAQKLALEGNCIFTPIYSVIENLEITKEHFKKIELSDAIYVINKNNYIGESTKLEIEYAKSLNKEIVYYVDLLGEK